MVDPFTRRRIVARYTSSEESVDELGRVFGVSSRTILRIAREAGVERRIREPFTEEELIQMADLYTSGLTSEQIAPKFRCNPWSILKALRLRGVKARRGRAAHRKKQRFQFGKGCA